MPNGKLTSGQWDYVNGIAKDFDFNTFDDLAVFLGFRDSDHLANECFAGADLYSCLVLSCVNEGNDVSGFWGELLACSTQKALLSDCTLRQTSR